MKKSKKNKVHLENVLEVMTEEQLDSMFILMQEMFVEVMMDITSEEDEIDKPPADDDQTFDDDNPRPVITAVKKEIKQKANRAFENFKKKLFDCPEKKSS